MFPPSPLPRPQASTDGSYVAWSTPLRIEICNPTTGVTTHFLYPVGTSCYSWDSPYLLQALPAGYPYTITVQTQDGSGDMFDGDVCVTLIGENGLSTAERLLSNAEQSGVNFASGAEASFTVDGLINVGQVQSVLVRLLADGGEEWALGKMEVCGGEQGAA